MSQQQQQAATRRKPNAKDKGPTSTTNGTPTTTTSASVPPPLGGTPPVSQNTSTTKSVSATTLGSSSSSPSSSGVKKETSSQVNANAPSSSSGSNATDSNYPTSFTASENKLMYDRTLWVVINLVGKHVEAQVKTGEFYEGILHSATTDKGLGVVLKMARKRDTTTDKKQSRPIDTFVIYPPDLVQIYAKEVSFDVAKDREFATDTDISAGVMRRERQLQPWMPDSTHVDDSLEFDDSGKTDWDQFEVNKQLFGVDTTFQEEFYTTPLDRGSSFYKQKSMEAARIAQEIEGKQNSNIHVLEERGLKIEADYDEEERYSSVIRDSGKYIPPAKRTGALKSSDDGKQAKKEPKAEKSADGKEEAHPPVTHQASLERTDSIEEFTEGSRSPSTRGSPRSPLTERDAASLATERLRLRLSIVNEKYKNSAPVVQKEDKGFPSGNLARSPLVSPLIGDARSVNALSLEPSTPNISEEVVKEFFDFSLEKSKKQQESARDRTIAELKKFSKSIEKKVTKNESGEVVTKAEPASDKTPEVKEETKTASPKVEPKTETKAEETKVELKGKTETTPTKTEPTKATTEATKKEATKETTSESTPSETASSSATPATKSTLNPNAKEFKPMRANAPAFTPSTPVFVPMIPQEIPEEHPWGIDPYMYQMQGRPMYSYPQSGIPGQPPVMAPVYPVRMIPGPTPFAPYPAMNGPYPAPAPYPFPQPQIPPATQNSPPQPNVAKRFPPTVPPKLPSGPGTPTYPNPAFVMPQGQRLPYPPAPFYPNGPRPMGANYEEPNRDQS